MDMNEVAIFVKVLQIGSFTKAAQSLELPKSTVSAKVAALEKRLGVSLIRRTTRQLHATEAGAAFYQVCRQALADIDGAAAAAAVDQRTPSGLLRVTAPVDLGAQLLPQFLRPFLARYPLLQVELILTSRIVDLIAESIDVAIRAAPLTDSTLIARKVSTSAFGLYAAPDYLAQAPPLQHPRDLPGQRCIRFLPLGKGSWRLTRGKETCKVAVDGPAAADDLIAVRALASAGLGIALLPEFMCTGDLRFGRLVPVLPGWIARTDQLCLVYAAQKFVEPKVKVFVAEAAENFTAFFAGA